MSKQEFYIGWQEEMPEETGRFLRKVIIGVGILVPIIILIVVLFQRPFNDHVFEFGTTTSVTGVYIADPFPMLQVTKDKPAQVSESLLLVGFGKFGAKGIMEEIEEREGVLDLQEITLNGTLIYGDGVALMELTNEANSFEGKTGNYRQPLETSLSEKQIELTGEILDAKCYFGVMKPGEGKIHRSCAIRCISGGIPPVIRVLQEDNSYDYFLITGPNGEEVNQDVLPYVGELITIKGKSYKQLDWNVIEIEPSTIQKIIASNE
ncbi:MAG: hypothetical protein F6K19_06935 [Cyanothece sp. SIO1E1]|nr:hypothetical protein [Cyanothece sp. SIO1E1]